MKENDQRAIALERRLRREAQGVPGPQADLAARIMQAVDKEVSAPAPRLAWRRQVLWGALATAAGIFLWLGVGRRSEEAGAERAASALLTHAPPLLGLGDQATKASSGRLRAWVDEPLLREMEQWVESGNRAAQRYASLIPSALWPAETREG